MEITQEKFDEIAKRTLGELGKTITKGEAELKKRAAEVQLVMACPAIRNAIAMGLSVTERGNSIPSTILLLVTFLEGGIELGKALSEYEQLEALHNKT